ncbi:MAG: biopolymer transporter ExbD [Pseudomonadota bacterium]
MRFRKQRDAVQVLNITPLIDVVFILLVFFMIATNFASYRLIRVETPQGTEVVQTSEGAIVVLIEDGGGLSFDTRPIDTEALGAVVAAVIELDPGRVFLVRPAIGVSLQEAIDVYDRIRRNGATSVSFSPPTDEGDGGWGSFISRSRRTSSISRR